MRGSNTTKEGEFDKNILQMNPTNMGSLEDTIKTKEYEHDGRIAQERDLTQEEIE